MPYLIYRRGDRGNQLPPTTVITGIQKCIQVGSYFVDPITTSDRRSQSHPLTASLSIQRETPRRALRAATGPTSELPEIYVVVVVPAFGGCRC